MESIVDIEWGLSGRRVGCIVVGKFCKREKVMPIVLLIVDEATKVLLKDLVDSFCLSISLRVEGRRQFDVHLEQLKEALPELRNKLRTSVTDYVLWHSMESENMLEEEVCSV
jgi:hypothetical protein